MLTNLCAAGCVPTGDCFYNAIGLVIDGHQQDAQTHRKNAIITELATMPDVDADGNLLLFRVRDERPDVSVAPNASDLAP